MPPSAKPPPRRRLSVSPPRPVVRRSVACPRRPRPPLRPPVPPRRRPSVVPRKRPRRPLVRRSSRPSAAPSPLPIPACASARCSIRSPSRRPCSRRRGLPRLQSPRTSLAASAVAVVATVVRTAHPIRDRRLRRAAGAAVPRPRRICPTISRPRPRKPARVARRVARVPRTTPMTVRIVTLVWPARRRSTAARRCWPTPARPSRRPLASPPAAARSARRSVQPRPLLQPRSARSRRLWLRASTPRTSTPSRSPRA